MTKPKFAGQVKNLRWACLFNKFTALLLVVLMTLSSFSIAYAQPSMSSPETQELSVAIIPDLHVIPQSMWANCPCSAAEVIADRRMTAESQAIFEAVIDNLISQAPDVILIPGNLTRSGEYHAHRFVAERLAYLQAALPDTTILVMRGEGDINNQGALDFSVCPPVPTPTVTSAEFREIYADFGFADSSNEFFFPASGEAGGLSYAARPADGFTIIAIDTGSSGSIDYELLAWIMEQVEEADKRGDTVMTFMHHNLIPHFSMQAELMSGSLVNNFPAIGTAFADAGIRYVFTGNLHAQSIAEHTTPSGNTVFDIQTGSPVVFPSPVRYATFTKTLNSDGALVEREVYITTTNITEIDFYCPVTGDRVTDLDQKHGYGWNNSLTREMFNGLLEELLGEDFLNMAGLIQDLLDVEFTNTRGVTHTGLRAVLESSLPTQDASGAPISNDAADFVLDMLRLELPMDLDGLVVVIDQPAQNRIRMNALGGIGGVNITYANLRLHLVDSIFNQFDALLADEDFINSLLDRTLNGLIDMIVYIDGENEYSLFDFMQYVYLSFLSGDAESTPWVEAIIVGLDDGSITSNMADYLVGLLMPELNELLDSITVNTGALITADTGLAAITSIPLRLLVLALFGDPANLGSMLSMFGMDLEDLLGDAGGDLIPPEVLDEFGTFVVDLAASLLRGSNSAHMDNNAIIRFPDRCPDCTYSDMRISVRSHFSLSMPGDNRTITNDVVVGDIYVFSAEVRAYPEDGEMAYGVRLYKEWPEFMCDDLMFIIGAENLGRGGRNDAYLVFYLGDMEYNVSTMVTFVSVAIAASASQSNLIQRFMPVSMVDNTACCGPIFSSAVSILSEFSLSTPGNERAITNDVVVGDTFVFSTMVRAYPGSGEVLRSLELYKEWPEFMGDPVSDFDWRRGGRNDAYIIFYLGNMEDSTTQTVVFSSMAIAASDTQGHLIQRLSSATQSSVE